MSQKHIKKFMFSRDTNFEMDLKQLFAKWRLFVNKVVQIIVISTGGNKTFK